MAWVRLSKSSIRAIEMAIDALFLKAKARFLGPDYVGKRSKSIWFGYKPILTLTGMYNAASIEERNHPDEHILKNLKGIAEGYLDALHARVKSRTVQAVDSFLREAQVKGVKTDVKTVLGGQLVDIWKDASSAVERIVSTETNTAKNIAILDGVAKVAAAHGIDDPTVAFLSPIDQHRCRECERLHFMNDGVTPRVWKLSELKHGYAKKGDDVPSVNGQHPMCRGIQTAILPGYGFTDGGAISFISYDYDVWADQRGMEKAEDEPQRLSAVPDKINNPANPKPPKKPKIPKLSNEPNLVVTHNLTMPNFEHAKELGGLVAPSIAIAHKDHPLEGFGDITLVGGHDLVDPAKGVPVFNADAYSPRFPSRHVRVKPKEFADFVRWLAPHAKRTAAYIGDLEDEFTKSGAKSMADINSPLSSALGAAFLEHHGHQAPIITKRKSIQYDFVDQPALHAFFAKHGHKVNFGHGDEYHRGLSDAASEAIDSFYNSPDRLDLDPVDRQEFINTAKERSFTGPEDENPGLFYFSGVHRLIEGHQNIGEKEVDRYGTQDVIRKQIKTLGLEDEYHKWAHEKLKPIEGDPYIPKYNQNGQLRRLPYTAENILKEMTRKIQGGEGFNYGLGSTRAAGAKKFRSLEGVAADRHSIVSKEKFTVEREKLNKKFFSIAEDIARYHSNESGMWKLDALTEAMAASYRRGKSLRRELEASGFKDVPDRLIERLRDLSADLLAMPTEYFEAKPKRVVGLEEFKGAAVPNTITPEQLETIKSHIPKIEVYDPNDTEGRKQAIQKLAEVQGLYLSEHTFDDAFEELSKSDDYYYEFVALEKAWNDQTFSEQIGKMGWKYHSEGGSHENWHNPLIGTKKMLHFKHEHRGGEIPDHWLREYGRQMGLKYTPTGYRPDPNNDEWAPLYRKAGLLPPLGQVPPVKTWTPAEPHEHLPIGEVKAEGRPLDNRQFISHMQSMQFGKPLPPIKVMDLGEGPEVVEGHELFAAAQKSGMTHVPVVRET